MFVPICTLETLKVHSHTESCYDAEQNQICTYTDAMVHVHDQRCFDEAGQLWCPLPELPAHVHEENCYGENGVLQCEKDKLPSHQHGDGCFQEQPKQTEANPGETEPAEELSSEAEAPSESQTEAQTEAQTETQTELQTETQTEIQTETELQSELETEPGAALLGSTYAVTPRASVSITYYIYVNGERYTLQTQTSEREKDGERYYVTPEELESIYGKFGFKASAYQGERLFPHTDSNGPNQIWADAVPYSKDGSWRIPLATRTQIYVYYLPANTAGSSSYFTDSKAITDAGMIADNQFFSVSVYEPSGTVANSYVRSGQDLVLTLDKRDDYDWHFYNADTEEALTPETAEQEDGTIRYTVRSVSVPIQVKPKLKDTVTNGSFTILYTADTLKDQKVKLGQFQVGEQIQLSEGSIGGMASASEQVTLSKGESHDLKFPDSKTLYVRVWDNRKFTYLFEGWRDKKSGVLLGYEDPISFETLYQHAQDGIVELEAVWSPLDGRGNIRSLNFYLNLACEIMDFGNTGYNPQPQNKFTQSLFHTYVNTSGQNAQFFSDYQLLAPPTTEATAYDVDEILRKMTYEEYKSFTLAQFPSDEEIFAELRAKNAQITLNNEVIPLQYLSTDYFQIRWYVMKYATSDGWHIDGILVAKRAKLNVTKSFLGDPITIE